MSMFKALVTREWREWRNVMIVLGILYTLVLVGSAVAMRRGASAMFNHDSVRIELGHDNNDDDDDEFFGEEWGWKSVWDEELLVSGETILFVYAHSLRGTASMISFVLIFLAMFYFSDSVYKERSDGSTFFHRSLPVQDHILLLSKLFAGTVGILTISYLLALFSVGIARIAVPSALLNALSVNDLSLSQIAYIDFMIDWLAYHVLLLLWLLPYATYMLLVSSATRSRPLLVGLGIPVLLAAAEGYFFQTTVLGEFIMANLESLSGVLTWEWQGKSSLFIDVGEQLQLFDSFGGYIISMRSLVSLVVASLLFFGSWKIYQKNVTPS